MAGAARSWRWPWRPPAGMVRVSKDAHIETLTAALHAAELEREILAKSAEVADYRREARARYLAEEQTGAAGVRLAIGDIEGLLADVPQRADGVLHEEAFLALLGQLLRERRLGDRIPTITSTRNGDDRS